MGYANCIPENSENYITFSKSIPMDPFLPCQCNRFIQLKFIDMMNFMAKSLEVLVANLPKDKSEHMSKRFQGEELDLSLRKCVFPYEYLEDI